MPSTTTTPSPTLSLTPESGLTGPTVVIDRELSDGTRVLVAYDLDDGTTRQLTTLDGEDRTPAVDAAGTSVVVADYPVPPNDPEPTNADHLVTSHLVLVDLITGERQPLTEQKEGVTDFNPQWNRAGDGLVYFTRGDGRAHTAGLWRVDVSTGEVEEFLNGAAVAWGGFALEPGGDSIWVGFPPCWFDKAFTCPTEASHPAQFTRLDLTTGSVSRHPFKGDSRWPAGDVAWTPDGAWFAYTRNTCGYPPCPELLIKRWPDGAPRTPLTMPVGEGATTTYHQFGQVGWHPDGSLVVLADFQFSCPTAETLEGCRLSESRILLVDTANGSAFPIGPASVDDQSFDVWAPPATR